MSRRRGPAVARRQLRLKLRQARTKAEKTQKEVADALDWSPSKVLRIENGQQTIAISDVVALATLYGISDETERNELIGLARESRKDGITVDKYRDILPPTYAEWLDLEAYAEVIKQFETKLVAGPLQTEEYARAILRAYVGADGDEETINRLVGARLERAKPLLAEDGPAISIILDEAVLRHEVGNESEKGSRTRGEIMISQLNRLMKLNTQGRLARGESIEAGLNRRIEIRIVPFGYGAYAALRGPFEILQFGEEDDFEGLPRVYLENPEVDVMIRDDFDEAVRYIDTFDGLRESLADPAQSNEMLEQVIRDIQEGRNGLAVRGS